MNEACLRPEGMPTISFTVSNRIPRGKVPFREVRLHNAYFDTKPTHQPSMTALEKLLNAYRQAAVTEREKGTYFEELIACYLRNEATYRDLYSAVWKYGEWATKQGLDKRDTGIDLVAQTQGTGEFHAIQCKLYGEDYRLQKSDIDSFFTASGKKPFTHRVIVSTTNHWSEHAEDALRDQQPPVSKIDLHDLENSQIDWSRYQPKAPPVLKAQSRPTTILPQRRAK